MCDRQIKLRWYLHCMSSEIFFANCSDSPFTIHCSRFMLLFACISILGEITLTGLYEFLYVQDMLQGGLQSAWHRKGPIKSRSFTVIVFKTLLLEVIVISFGPSLKKKSYKCLQSFANMLWFTQLTYDCQIQESKSYRDTLLPSTRKQQLSKINFDYSNDNCKKGVLHRGFICTWPLRSDFSISFAVHE